MNLTGWHNLLNECESFFNSHIQLIKDFHSFLRALESTPRAPSEQLYHYPSCNYVSLHNLPRQVVPTTVVALGMFSVFMAAEGWSL